MNASYAYVENIFLDKHSVSQLPTLNNNLKSENIRKPFAKIVPLAQSIKSDEDDIEKKYWFIVFLLIYLSEDNAFRCTGSLLTPKWVLTTANCLLHQKIWARNLVVVASRGNLNQYLVHRMSTSFDKEVSENNIEERRVLYYRIHPSFDKFKSHHDVGLLKLKQQFSLTIQYGILSFRKVVKKLENCTIIGFGIYHNNINGYYMDAQIRSITNLVVSKPSFGCPTSLTQKKGDVLCFKLANKGFCKGDFGSPLMCGNKIRGISSSHIKSFLRITDRSCILDDENYYNDLYGDLDWIENIISGTDMLASVGKQTFLPIVTFLMAFNAS